MSALPSTPPEASPASCAADSAHGLYERHAAHVFRYCRRLLASREEAEDALQTTFVQAFSALSRGTTPEYERAWLLSIARNVCNDHWRRSQRRREAETGRDPAVLDEVLAAEEPDRDQLIPLRPALAALTGPQRRAILLREWQGLSYAEIAGDLGISRSAVETLIFRARRSLAQGLEPEKRVARRAGARALDVGSLVHALKSLVGGGAAAKVALASTVAATVVAGAPLLDRLEGRSAEPRTVEPTWLASSSGPPAEAIEGLLMKQARVAPTVPLAQPVRSRSNQGEKKAGPASAGEAEDGEPTSNATTGDSTTGDAEETQTLVTVVEEQAATAVADVVATTESAVESTVSEVEEVVEPVLATPLPSIDVDTSAVESTISP
ncbi:MAG: sigma-70 family RNA polymerase sigma factor [Actinobacteria bacterium]|nr:sigma-70 family RNA polymerase sigma factor [Actinomycetota bacterium]